MHYRFNTEIPDHYDEIALRILPCNPKKLFVFWDIPDHLRIESLKLVLKITQPETDNESETPVKEIELERNAMSCYIEAPVAAGLPYCLELGRILPDGSYDPIRSVSHNTPIPPSIIQPEFTEYETRNPGVERKVPEAVPEKPFQEKRIHRVLPYPYSKPAAGSSRAP